MQLVEGVRLQRYQRWQTKGHLFLVVLDELDVCACHMYSIQPKENYHRYLSSVVPLWTELVGFLFSALHGPNKFYGGGGVVAARLVPDHFFVHLAPCVGPFSRHLGIMRAELGQQPGPHGPKIGQTRPGKVPTEFQWSKNLCNSLLH